MRSCFDDVLVLDGVAIRRYFFEGVIATTVKNLHQMKSAEPA